MILLISLLLCAQPEITHGPFLGAIQSTDARIWTRVSEQTDLTLVVTDGADNVVFESRESADPESDHCVTFEIDGLAAGTEYTYRIKSGDHALSDGLGFTTPDEHSKIRIAFGSCSSDSRFPNQPVFTRMVDEGADLIVLLGDTPYIDSTKLDVQRQRYRTFYEIPELAAALQQVPFIATWDDHDFGRNDTDGNLAGKEFSRQAFMEYHANPSYGQDRQGIYTSVRYGAVEIFLLDTRWFAATEQSPVTDAPSLLGKSQWEWLLDGLRNSDAPVKILACGMIWNGATRPNKPDHWMTYEHERAALFEFIAENRISEVVLVGGDIHRSRALAHPISERQRLVELIASPLANRVIETANAPHPNLLHDVGEPETFIMLEVDMRRLPIGIVAVCMTADGEEQFRVHAHSVLGRR